MRKPAAVLACVLLGACAGARSAQPAPTDEPPHPLIGKTIGLDHVLLWAREQEPAQRYLERLGFRLTEKPGSYGAGISNRLVWFQNASFIEFLWLSDPALTAKEAPTEHAVVQRGNGSNAYGVQVEDVERVHTRLAEAGLRPEPPGGEAWDPDGPEGPKAPVVNRWRFMFLGEGALPGNPFFVEYNLPEGTPNPRSDQPNGAAALTSVWVVVPDVEAAAAEYGRAAFRLAGAVTLPSVGASGVALAAGQGEILLVAPTGPGPLHERLEAFGPHVIGMSIRVADLAATERLLTERLGAQLPRSRGRYGDAVLAPSFQELGVHLEFHGAWPGSGAGR